MLINNRYQLEETLGQGGAGVVYRAFDLVSDRPVAIKALTASKSQLDRRGERLRREASLLSQLTHPNIVGFYDLVEAAERPYLVIEYIAGSTLRDLMEAQPGPLPVKLAVHIISCVLAALKAAHQADIIHRDLKPENIMLVGVETNVALDLDSLQPEVKVTDFGLAYLSGDVRLTTDNLVAGTALYLAPEAAQGQPLDKRADLYAVGVILYEMMAGKPPFQGDDPLVVISQHLHASPISPRWHNPHLPPALARIILKLLAKNPADRYPTVEAVLTELETVQQTGSETGRLTKASLLDAIARGRWVGREKELSFIRNAIDNMLRGKGGMIFIEGASGVGKSRLVGEANVYAHLNGAQVFTGHCYDADLALPYHPFIEIVKGYVQANLKSGSTGYLPAGLASELVRLAPGLETHLGVAPAPDDSSPAEARLRLFEAVVTLLANGPHPIMLILENLHRASPPDLALLAHLARTGTHNRRLLIIVTYRDDPWQQEQVRALSDLSIQLSRANLATQLRLKPLSADDTSALLETFLEGEIAPALGQAIFKVTEGNPFFIEETLIDLIEDGRIFRDPNRNRWDGRDVEQLKIPASLKEVIDRRFEKFSRTQRQLLSLAALLGRRFRLDALLAAAETAESEVLETLDAAVEMQLLRLEHPAEETADTEVYVFEHALVRRTLRESLNTPQRRRMHRQIGHALETLNNQTHTRQIAPPDKLAYHFGEAGGDDTEKAISYSLIAVENALQIHASEAAIKHYLLILDLLPAEAVRRRAWILEQLGDLYFRRTRQIVNAVATYESAIQLWPTAPEPNPKALVRLYRNMGEIARYWPGHIEKLDTYLTEALRLLDEDPGEAKSLERARVLAAMAFGRHARLAERPDKETLKLAQAAADLAVQLDAPDVESTALDAQQRIYRAQGNLSAAHAVDHRRLELIPHLTKPAEAIDAHMGASQMGWETGDLMAASKYCLEALAIAQRIDNIGGQWEALRRLVMLHLQWGKLPEATTYAGQGGALGPRAGLLEFGEPVEAIFHTHLAILHTLQGQAEAAAHELAELKALYPTPEAPPYRAALGWLYYETETWAQARPNLESGQAFSPPFVPVYFERVLLFEIYGHLGDETALNQIKPAVETEVGYWELPYFQAILNRGYGAFYARQGDWANAEAAFKSALAVTRRKTFWYQDARTWLDYGRMLAQRHQPGDVEMAREFLTEAQNLFATFGAHALAEKAWIELTRLGQRD